MSAAFRKKGVEKVRTTGSMVKSISAACDLADSQRSRFKLIHLTLLGVAGPFSS